MSAAAQEFQRQLDEMKKQSSRRRPRMEDERPLGIEPDQPAQEVAAETPATDDANEVGGAEGAGEMAKKTTKTAAKKLATRPARTARPIGEKKAAAPRAAKTPRAAKAPRVKAEKPPVERSATAGIRKNPKNKVLFLNTDAALSVVKKALTAIQSGRPVGELTSDELREVERLLARIAARQQ